MAGKEHLQAKIKESDIAGLKYFDKLSPMSQRLHDDGCNEIPRAIASCTTISIACDFALSVQPNCHFTTWYSTSQ